MSTTTTQVLFNSPALHSLKREQLVKLCKIHSLKANGKNVELIQRLRQHARSLPKDTPSECDNSTPMQTDDDDQHAMQEDEIQSTNHRPRPSEQWEMVMDSIEEVEENSSQGTLSSQRTAYTGSGEFGTGGSAGSTVSSSIKALATSLGLRRTMSKLPSDSTSSRTTTATHGPIDEVDLATNSKPYSTIPVPTALPQTDRFMLDTGRRSLDTTEESPLPGHALRPGVPAPANARLSLGLGIDAPVTPTRKAQPTTTIRLVSNPLSQQEPAKNSGYDQGGNGTPQLKPFQTTFDITFGSPVPGNAFNSGFGGFMSFPKVINDAEMTASHSSLTSDVIHSLPLALSGGAADESHASPSGLRVPTSPPPFIFGSPCHGVSNNQFRNAAASVLEEMNARLRAKGIDEIGADIINKLHPGRKCSPAAQREIKPIPKLKRTEITRKFDEVHHQEFSRMQGIDDTSRRRQSRPKELQPEAEEKGDDNGSMVVGRKRKSDVLEQGSRPRRPSVPANKARVSQTRAISTGRRSKVIPGGFGFEDEEAPDDLRAGKRVRTDSDSLTRREGSKRQEDERELQLEKEKESIRKKLEANKARRRSSAAGRKSLGRNGPRPSVLVKAKPKPSRFGFLASAKSLVQSVWSRGKSPAPASNIPKLTAAPPAQTELVHGQPSKEDKGKTKMAPPAFVPNRKAALAPAKPTAVTASGNKITVTSVKSNNMASKCAPGTQNQASLVSTRSSRSRSPLPSFSSLASNSSASGIASGKSWQTKDSRASSVVGTAKSRSCSAGVSSVGRFSGLNTSNTAGSDNIGSMGTKKTIGGASRKSSVGNAVSSSSTSRTTARTRTSSRLLAPTASSLAKTVHQSTSNSLSADDGRNCERRKETTALGSITSQVLNRSSSSQRDDESFTKPLLLPTQSGVFSTESGEEGEGEGFSSNLAVPQRSAPMKRTLSGRKPRISRSKVIAKLASQRAASGSSISSTRSSSSGTSVLKPRMATSSGRTRSSLGVKVARASCGSGMKGRSSSGGGNGLALAISAKRLARQSEYSRRRSSRSIPSEGDTYEV